MIHGYPYEVLNNQSRVHVKKLILSLFERKYKWLSLPKAWSSSFKHEINIFGVFNTETVTFSRNLAKTFRIRSLDAILERNFSTLFLSSMRSGSAKSFAFCFPWRNESAFWRLVISVSMVIFILLNYFGVEDTFKADTSDLIFWCNCTWAKGLDSCSVSASSRTTIICKAPAEPAAICTFGIISIHGGIGIVGGSTSRDWYRNFFKN